MKHFFLIIIAFLITTKSTSDSVIPEYVLVENNDIKIEFEQYIGIRYVWGGTTKKGIDCSGLTQLIYKEQFNIQLPRVSRHQAKQGLTVDLSDIKVGDLLFYKRKGKVSHVSIYLGNNSILHATSRGVIIDKFSDPVWNNYWKPKLYKIKRILNE